MTNDRFMLADVADMLADVLERGACTAMHPSWCLTCGVEAGSPCGPVDPLETAHPERVQGDRVLALTLQAMANEARTIRKRLVG